MPNIIKKKGKCYEVTSKVKDKKTGKIKTNLHAKCTTKKKAEAQKRILDQYNRKTQIFDKYGPSNTKQYKQKMKNKYPAKKSGGGKKGGKK